MLTLRDITSLRSMPALRGKPPTMTAMSTPLHAVSRSVVATTSVVRQQLREIERAAAVVDTSLDSWVGVSARSLWWRALSMRRKPRTNKQRVGSVQQLHLYSLKSSLGGLDVQHMQDDLLLRAQHLPTGRHGHDGIADLACEGVSKFLMMYQGLVKSLMPRNAHIRTGCAGDEHSLGGCGHPDGLEGRCIALRQVVVYAQMRVDNEVQCDACIEAGGLNGG